MPRPPALTTPSSVPRAVLAAAVAVLCAATPSLAAFTGVVERAGSGARAAAVFRPVPLDPPLITGRALVGERLATGDGVWDRDPAAFARTWERCDGDACVVVGDGETYVLADADLGHRVRVRVTASNAGGAVTSTSAPTDVVAASSLTHTSAPAVTGAAVVGEPLAVAPGAWPDGATLSHRWQRCDPACDDIPGADAATYRPTPDDVGHALRVIETARLDGRTAFAPSAATDPVRTRYRHAILTSAVVAFWPFDEPAGLAFADVLGGPVATLAGSGASVLPGLDPPSAALELDGGQLTAPSTPGTTPTDSFGVEAWIRPATTDNAIIVSKANDALTSGYVLEIANGRFRMRVMRNGSRATAFGGPVRAGEWTYVSANHEGASMRVFTNGTPGESVAAVKPGATNAPTRIGPLHGTIDEVALYGANLTVNRVNQRWALLADAAGH